LIFLLNSLRFELVREEAVAEVTSELEVKVCNLDVDSKAADFDEFACCALEPAFEG